MIDPTKLPPSVLAALRCRFGEDADDTTVDARIAQLSPAQAFREFCTWNGLPGSWGDILMDALRGCEAAAATTKPALWVRKRKRSIRRR